MGNALTPNFPGRINPPRARRPWVVPAPTQAAGVPQSVSAGYSQVDSVPRIAIALVVAYTFLRFSYLHEWLTIILHVRPFLSVLLMVPTVAVTVIGGGVARAWRSSPARFWLMFACWLLFATLLSWWKSGSLPVLTGFFMDALPFPFIIGGMIGNWADCRKLLNALAGATVIVLLATYHFARGTDRMRLSGGSIGDPNDLAAFLLLLLPFLLILSLTPGRIIFVRVGGMVVTAFGLFLVLNTGSRGALVAVIVALLFIFLRVSMEKKLLLLVVVSIAGIAIGAALPKTTLTRLVNTFSSGDSANAEDSAEHSKEARAYLLKTSLLYTIRHPFFGIGPGTFSSYEGTQSRQAGQHGSWHETHNAYTQISSEVGIPALLFVLSAIVSTYRLLNKVYLRARGNPEYQQIAVAAFCLMLSLVAFCSAILFLSLAYTFYLPAMAGLAIALSESARKEFEKTSLAQPAVEPALTPGIRRTAGMRPAPGRLR